MKFGVVIPTYNEADYIGRTIESLAAQRDDTNAPYGPDVLEVVIADTPGQDRTADTAIAIGVRHPNIRVTVITETQRSMVAARIAGFDYLSRRADGPPDVLISADADTTFPEGWLAAIGREIERGYPMVSTSGCFEHAFWLNSPTLTRRYIEEIGTIFFNSNTAAAVLRPGDRPVFTSALFGHFGRPVADCGLAITTDLYRSLGGIRHDYYDDECRRPILAVGWPLMFRAELAGHTIGTIRKPEYETSARRLLHEPRALFSGSSYLDEIEHYRRESPAEHAWLESFANRLDMEPLRRYVVKNYILQQCITRPDRIIANSDYFGDIAGDVVHAVAEWHAQHPSPEIRHIFDFSNRLLGAFYDTIITRARLIATH